VEKNLPPYLPGEEIWTLLNANFLPKNQAIFIRNGGLTLTPTIYPGQGKFAKNLGFYSLLALPLGKIKVFFGKIGVPPHLKWTTPSLG